MSGEERVPRGSLRVLALLSVTFLLLEVFIGEALPRAARAQTPGPPNIILILTDDQRFDTLKVMPEVRRLLVERGMTLRRAIITNPLCCPSRATILTGRYSHTTGVYTNSPLFGGWSTFQASESSTIATALHDAGYRTALVGKYMNGYNGETVSVPPGWDRWFALVSTGRLLQLRGARRRTGNRELRDRAVGVLDGPDPEEGHFLHPEHAGGHTVLPDGDPFRTA